MASWYSKNSLSVNNGHPVVTGSGTNFSDFVYAGFGIVIEGVVYEIKSVDSATQLTLGHPYNGDTNSTAQFAIWPTQGLNFELWRECTELVDLFGPLTNDMNVLNQQIADTLAAMTAASTSASDASAQAALALLRANAAEASATTAGTQAGLALTRANAAEAAKQVAETARDNASTHSTAANNSRLAAASHAADALTLKNTVSDLRNAVGADVTTIAGHLDAAQDAREAADDAKELSEAARDTSVAAKEVAITSRLASEAAAALANTHNLDAQTAKGAAEDARDVTEGYRDDTETVRNDSIDARDAAIAAKAGAEAEKAGAETARIQSVAAKDASVVAKNQAEVFRDLAELYANQAQTPVNSASIEAALGYIPIGPDNPTFTGTISGVTKAMVGLGDVDNTSDADKPISSDTQDALDLKLPAEAFGNAMNSLYNGPITTFYGYGSRIVSVENTYNGINDNLNLKAPIASPTFTGTVSGITKAMVGLANVDNTADSAKPVSTAQQTALNAKLGLNGGQLTGALEIRHSAPYLYLRDTDQNSAALHCNSGYVYVLRGGTDTTTMEQVNSVWPLKISLTNNDVTAGGNLYARGTSLVWDQGNLTNVSQLTNNAGYVTSSGTVASAGNADTVDGLHDYNLIRRSDQPGNNAAWSRSLLLAGHEATTDIWSSPIELREVNYVGNSNQSAAYWPGLLFHHSATAAAGIKMANDGSIRHVAQGGGYANTFQNNGYFADWIRPMGAAGIYWDAYGRGITAADNGATYGNITTYGTGMNSWTGYSIGNWMQMMSNGSTHGIHSQNLGQWLVNWDTGGNAWFPANITAYSDERIKENMRPIANAMARLKGMAAACITYERVTNQSEIFQADRKGAEAPEPIYETRLGFGAQTLEKSNPELVSTSDDLAGTKGVNYGDAVAVVAINAQMQADRIEVLEAENTQLKSQLEDVLKRLEKAGL